MNFTAKYLGILGNKITDSRGLDISTLRTIKDKKFFFEYRKPRIICDILQKEKVLIEPEIREIKYDDLSRKELCIVSMKKRFRKGGSIIYKIIKKTRFPKNAKIIERVPHGHHIEFDMANKVIRLVGRNVGITGYGEWVAIEER